ncbi:MAG: hypothetical protein ABW208_00930 [Pyrinomonadaceae bacterium]
MRPAPAAAVSVPRRRRGRMVASAGLCPAAARPEDAGGGEAAG